MEIVAWNRIPFLTSKGRLGLGPNTMLLGDTVSILLGCQTPFVLRKTEVGHYRIVGEAYLEGTMNGELMDDKAKMKELTIV